VSNRLAFFEKMLTIRRFEEIVAELKAAGHIAGSVHLCIGQEAVCVGALAPRRNDDPVFATYRGHGWALACGCDSTRLLAELCGRESGVNAGRGGSAYLSAADCGFYGENSIVGAGAPIAVGAAVACKQQGGDRVVVVDFGDGAINQGSVHEALNMAAAFRLPVVFVCENNRYSELTPIERMVANERLHERAAGYGMPGIRVDGNDVEAVAVVAEEAFVRARTGGGPTLIEAMTYRLVGHYVGDPEPYRDADEIDAARQVEPLVRAREGLASAGHLVRTVEQRVERSIADARVQALTAPQADRSRVQEHLYA
jgi:pyruvate dehydrogenase E1 component alpha subunit